MKKIIISAALLGLSTGVAYAVDQEINLTATVPAFCTIGGSTTPAAINQAIPVGATGNVNTATINVPLGAVVCNKAANVQLSSLKGGLFSATEAATGFQNRINYGATLSGPAAATVAASASAVTPTSGAQLTTSGATSDPAISVAITPAENALPLVAANDYSDTLTVSITPTP